MPRTEILSPTDQPTNKRRLLVDLKAHLTSGEHRLFALAVAFAKAGAMYRLLPAITDWRNAGGRSVAIFGIDQRGTSYQALDLALKYFERVYVTFHPRSSFHPKCYCFIGDGTADIYVGSHNLTVGGTELNFESGVHLNYTLPDERKELLEAWEIWAQLLPHRCPCSVRLTSTLLEELNDKDLLLDENAAKNKAHTGGTAYPTKKWTPTNPLGKKLAWVPPSPIPGDLFKKTPTRPTRTKGKTGRGQPLTPATPAPSGGVTALIIQIRPHHNGEIFLSKIAVNQNPTFFEFPFSGHTTPKKPGNPTYPQRLPDPRVDIYVYGEHGAIKLQLIDYGLNTVYYSKKEEIRITAKPIIDITPEFSVMIMHRTPDGADRDYIIEIHRPDSPAYNTWLRRCDQKMPGGGSKSRYFGWL